MKKLSQSLLFSDSVQESKKDDTNVIDDPISVEDVTAKASPFPSRKSIISGVYKKLQVYFEEEVEKRRLSLHELKTPGKADNSVHICSIVLMNSEFLFVLL